MDTVGDHTRVVGLSAEDAKALGKIAGRVTKAGDLFTLLSAGKDLYNGSYEEARFVWAGWSRQMRRRGLRRFLCQTAYSRQIGPTQNPPLRKIATMASFSPGFKSAVRIVRYCA